MAGHDVTVAQLLQAASEVTKLYADRGYPLSFAFVPAQTFEGGVVRITVVEGYVARMRIEGKPGPLEERLRAISKHMMDERPLRRETFERVTGVLALQPGVQITATVQPPTTTDGASELVLDVKRQPYTIGTGIEYRSPGVRAVVTGTLNGLTPLGEQISVSTLQPRGRDDEKYYSATWAQPIGTDGLLAKLTWSHYRGRPENLPLEQLGYQSRYLTDAQRLGLSLSYPLLLSNTRSLTLTGTFYANEDMQRYSPQNLVSLPSILPPRCAWSAPKRSIRKCVRVRPEGHRSESIRASMAWVRANRSATISTSASCARASPRAKRMTCRSASAWRSLARHSTVAPCCLRRSRSVSADVSSV